MDLFLAPCRNCLQCLPFFHLSSPPPLRNHADAASMSSSLLVASSAAAGDTSSKSGRGDEDKALSSTNTTVQQQDLPISEVKAELCTPGETQEGSMEPALPALMVETQADKCEPSTALAEVENPAAITAISEIIIAPPVSTSILPAMPETSKTTVPSELPLNVPFINDVTFSTAGLMPLPSPMTPAPMGSGYPQGPHQLQHEHGALHYEHGHHHDHPVPSHVPIPHRPSEFSHDPHNDLSHHHEHHHHHASEHDEHHGPEHGHHGDHCPYHQPQDSGDEEKVIPSHHESGHSHHYDPEHSHHQLEHPEGAFPTLQTSQSAPVPSIETKHYSNHEAGDINGTGLLEAYHSEPIWSSEEDDDDQHVATDVLHGDNHDPVQRGHRRRRRDHLKDQFTGIREQIKHGGHHLKEEGSKHVQSIVNNINKHAQQIEESASFFNVPRT